MDTTKNTIPLTPSVLIEWRERMGYSKTDACNALGCSRGAYAGWEDGTKRIPRYIGLATAALATGIDFYAAAPDPEDDEGAA